MGAAMIEGGAKRMQVVSVGHFPPPVHGCSYITRCMTDLIAKNYSVREVVINAPVGVVGLRKHFIRFARALYAVCIIFKSRGFIRTCYISGEGSFGLIYNVMVAFAAVLVGATPYIHHHNYNYIDHYNPIMLILNRVMVRGVHIFLSEQMRHDFQSRYGVINKGCVISNAAFVPPVEFGFDDEEDSENSLVVGFLSNLTREKGLYLFLDLLRAAAARGESIRGILAGPVALEEDRVAIVRAKDELGGRLDYRGPIYGDDKSKFYNDIGIFVFPTNYTNEAQPTVIFEALAAGCQVVSYDRGCIATQVKDDGLVIPRDRDFVAAAMDWLVLANRSRSVRGGIITRYAARHARARGVIHGLFGPASHECLSSCAD